VLRSKRALDRRVIRIIDQIAESRESEALPTVIGVQPPIGPPHVDPDPAGFVHSPPYVVGPVHQPGTETDAGLAPPAITWSQRIVYSRSSKMTS
jgi:hypothetical protein